MRRQVFAALAAGAIVVGFAAAGNAASPSSGSVGPSSHSASWTGQSYAAGATPGPGACTPTDVLCDHYSLTVDADAAYWKTHRGSVSISIGWGDGSNNFDLYVYSGGSQVGASARSSGTSEGVTLSNPVGTYQVVVVPKKVVNSGYGGHASFTSTATDGGGGGGSGGSGGASGGSGSGGGGASGGSGGTGRIGAIVAGLGGSGAIGTFGGGVVSGLPTCPGCPSSFGSSGSPMSKEQVQFIYGIDRKSWYWQAQINQTIPQTGQNLTLPDPQNASTLPVQAMRGRAVKVPTLFFDLAQRGLLPGSRIQQFDLKIAEGDQAQDLPEYNSGGQRIAACLVTEYWPDSSGAELWSGLPTIDKHKCVAGKQGGKAPNQHWTFRLAPIVSAWDDPAKNDGVAFLPIVPKGAGPQNQNFQVNLLLPVHGDSTPPNTYDSTKNRVLATIAFTAPPTASAGNGGGAYSAVGTGGSFVGSGTVGTVTSGGTTTSSTTTTTSTTGGPASANPAQLVTPTAGLPPAPKVPGVVWWLIPLGLIGLWAIRQVVMEPAGGMRMDGVISAIRQRNAAAKGIPLAEREDSMTQAREATRRARSVLRRSLRRR